MSRYEYTAKQGAYINDLIYSKQQKINGTTYTLMNDDSIANLIATSHSKLVKKETDGAETIFYESDVSSQNEMYSKIYKYAAFTVFAVLVITLTTILLMIIKKKLKK